MNFYHRFIPGALGKPPLISPSPTGPSLAGAPVQRTLAGLYIHLNADLCIGVVDYVT